MPFPARNSKLALASRVRGGTLDERRCHGSGSTEETTRSNRQTFEDSEGSSRPRGSSGVELDSSIRGGDREDRRFRPRGDEGRIPGSLNSEQKDSRLEYEEGARGSRVKLRKSDSFLRRLVRSSRDNIAEGCERLVRNIQKSPLPVPRGNWKLLSSDDNEERPIPPLRRKKSRRNSENDRISGISSNRPLPPTCTILAPSIDVPSNAFVEIRITENRGGKSVSGDSSRSVSAEDAEDLIRAEEGDSRPLERRAAVGRGRLERSSERLLRRLRRGRSSWSEESLARHKSRVGLLSAVSREWVADYRWPARSDRIGSAEWRKWKAKRSPPPDDCQVGDRGSWGLESRRDNERRNNGESKNDKDKAEARKTRIRGGGGGGGGEVHARPFTAASLVKCKVANSAAGNGGDEEEEEEEEAEEDDEECNAPRRGSEEQRLVVAVGDDRSVDEGNSSIVASRRPPVRSRVVPCPSIPTRTDPVPTGDDARLLDLVTIRVVNEDARLKGGGGASTNEGTGNRAKRKGGRRVAEESSEEERKDDWKMKLAVRMIRIRDKLMLGLSAFAILFTILLVMDLQMDLGYSGHHLVPSHGRVRVGDDPNADTIYNNFRRKFLQRLNASKEQTSGDASATTQNSGGREGGGDEGGRRDSRTEKTEVHDSFPDLVDLVVKGYGVSVYEGVARISGEDRSDNPTLGELKKIGPK